MTDLEVVDRLAVEGAPEAADLAQVRHLRPHVRRRHVVDQQVAHLEALLADLADELEALLPVVLLEVRLHGERRLEVAEAVLALAQVGQVDGAGAVALHV